MRCVRCRAVDLGEQFLAIVLFWLLHMRMICHKMLPCSDACGAMTLVCLPQLLASLLRRRTWRHELQQLDAGEKVSSQGCADAAKLP